MERKIKTFKVLFLDADGVFFDGQEAWKVSALGIASLSKSRSYLDGQGISFLREIGIKIVFVSGEGEPLDSIVYKFNGLPSAVSGRWSSIEIFSGKKAKGQKLEAVYTWLTKNNVNIHEVAYMGDDLNDIEVMREIQKSGGLTICPRNGTRTVRLYADLIMTKSGGKGAIREFAERVLDARGINEVDFPPA